jgi:hypothetical protein
MNVKINKEKLLRETGRDFDTVNELLYWVDGLIAYCVYHNKNLTNTQYHKICEVQNILNCLEVSEQ